MAVTKVKSKSKKIAKNGKNKTMKKNIKKTMRGGARGITNLRDSVHQDRVTQRKIEMEQLKKSIADSTARIEAFRRKKANSLGSSTVPSTVTPRVKSSFFSGFSGFFNKKPFSMESIKVEPIKVKPIKVKPIKT